MTDGSFTKKLNELNFICKQPMGYGTDNEEKAQRFLRSLKQFRDKELDEKGRVPIDLLEKFCEYVMKNYYVLAGAILTVNDGFNAFSYSRPLTTAAGVSGDFIDNIYAKRIYELYEKTALMMVYYIKSGELKKRAKPLR